MGASTWGQYAVFTAYHKQEDYVANDLLKQRLTEENYFEVDHVAGLFKHKWRPIWFTLVVDDFGIKYVGEGHRDHYSTFSTSTTRWKQTTMGTILWYHPQMELQKKGTVCLGWTKYFFSYYHFFISDLACYWKVWVRALYCPKMSL